MFKWRETFEVNIKEIDKQHQELFRLGTELYLLISTKGETDQYDEIMKVINNLADYTVEHFSYEEGLMKDNDYPRFPEHKIQHDNFVKMISSIKSDDVDMNQKKIGMDLIVFIANWIEKHILVIDMKYKEYLNERGIY